MYSRNQLNDYYSQDGYEINTVYGLLKVIKDYVDWENAENLDALCATRFKTIIDIILAKQGLGCYDSKRTVAKEL